MNENVKIYKGNCLEVMDKLIDEGIKVDAIITDPPYGTTACKWDSIIPFDAMWERLKKLKLVSAGQRYSFIALCHFFVKIGNGLALCLEQ